MCRRLPNAALLLLSGLLLAAGEVRARGAEAAEMVARLFPGSKATRMLRHDRRSGKMVNAHRVLPVKRKGLWGYAENPQVQPVEGGLILAFELHMAAIERGKVAGWARSKQKGPRKYLQLIAVVLVDKQGKFVAKPDGFPLSGEINLDCLGDMCVGQGVALRSINRVEGSSRAAWLDLRIRGSLRAVGLIDDGRVVLASELLSYGSVEDQSGCGMGGEVLSASYRDHAIHLQLREHCDVEACPYVCAEEGIRAPARSAEREVKLEGMH